MFVLNDREFLRAANDEHAVLILKWPITECGANSYVIHRSLPQVFRLFVLKCLQAVRSIKRYTCLPFYMFRLSACWFNHVSRNVQHGIVNLKVKLTQNTF